ncbi:SGNH/GDSL hydrolase family protein (plasmid) [Streptomyces sp. CA-294286]|uniref:SGNH/GDSL hydrolase family protein n=1 Tax=Streptomyces sp. CA-294286 TaxID=3240070 RepID=UPI003D8A69CA
MILDRRGLLTAAALTASATVLPAAAGAPAPRTPALVPPGRPLTFGVVGDSITGRGSFASSRARPWTALLQARLAKSWTVTRVNGATSRDAQGVTCLATVDTVPFGCDLVVIGLGSNDCLARREGTYVYSPADTRAAARTLFTAVAAGNPDAVVVALGVWGDRALTWTGNGSAQPVSRVDSWDEIIGECCAENGGIHVRCADLYDHVAHRLPAGRPAFGGYTTDGYHPNDAGHEALYRRVAQRLDLP